MLHWRIHIELGCPQIENQNIDTICDRLVSHHAIMSAKPSIMAGTEDKTSGSSENIERKIVCEAIVTHSDDEKSVQAFIGKIRNISIEQFIPEKTRHQVLKVLKVTQFSAIIVFIVLVSHGLILMFTDKLHDDPVVYVFIIPLITALAVLGVDTAMVWREHHN